MPKNTLDYVLLDTLPIWERGEFYTYYCATCLPCQAVKLYALPNSMPVPYVTCSICGLPVQVYIVDVLTAVQVAGRLQYPDYPEDDDLY